MRKIRTYSEMVLLPSFEERFRYLQLDGKVGEETFGYDRYMNQMFYRSGRWKSVRDQVIIRDNGCDLGIDGREIFDRVLIHHMNPLLPADIENETDFLLNPEYLVCVSGRTHNAIHYGDESLLLRLPRERKPNDTCPWKGGNDVNIIIGKKDARDRARVHPV